LKKRPRPKKIISKNNRIIGGKIREIDSTALVFNAFEGKIIKFIRSADLTLVTCNKEKQTNIMPVVITHPC
jgi:hypothetical protein